MTVTFPLSEKRNAEELLKHLRLHNLSYPGSCAVNVKTLVAHVTSSNTYSLSTARTAW